MAEAWINLEDQPVPAAPAQPKAVTDFLATLPAAKARPAVDETEFLSTLPNAPTPVFEDPAKIDRAKTLSATLNMPFGTAYNLEEGFSEAFNERDVNWLKTAKDSFKAGFGDVYVAAGRALEWAGFGEAAKPYLDFGNRLRDAYIPPIKPEEFTFDKIIDPVFWATSVTRSVPSLLSLIPAAIVGGYGAAAAGTAIAGASLGAFGKLALATVGGAAFSRSVESAFEAGGAYDEAINRGLDPETASERAEFVFKRNLMLAGTDAAQFALAFTPIRVLGSKVPRLLQNRAIAVGTRLLGVGAIEAGEEAYQEAIQQLARGEAVRWSPEMKEAAAIGAIFGVGLGGAGSVFNALSGRIESKMPPNLVEDYRANEQAALAMGSTPEQAKLKSLDALADTPGGAKHIENVLKELVEVAEGKEPPAITQQDLDQGIERIEAEEAFTLEAAEAVEEEAFSDKTLEAIASGESDIETELGLEPSEAEKAEQNFIVSEEVYQRALLSLREKTSGLRAGVDPTVLKEFATIGVYHIERGVKKFADWSKLMVEQFGEAIKPHLLNVWQVAQSRFAATEQGREEAQTILKQGNRPLRTSQQEVQRFIEDHVEALEKANGPFEYRGKTYNQAIREGRNVRLKGDEKDAVVRGTAIMEIEEALSLPEEAPFDVPGEDIAARPLSQGAARFKGMVQEFERAKQPVKAAKSQIRLTTGQKRISKMVSEDAALRAAFLKAQQNSRIAYRSGTKDALERAKAEFRDVLLKAQAGAETFGFRQGFKLAEKLTRKEMIAAFRDGQKTVKETQQMLIGYIEENLPGDVRGKFLNAIIQNLTKRKQESIMRRVDALQDRLTKKELIAELKELRTHKGNVAVEYQRRVDELLKDFDAKRISARTVKRLEDLREFADREGMPSGVSSAMLEDLRRLEKIPAAEMRTEDLRAVVEIARRLKEIGKLKLELKYRYNERERELARQRLLDSTINLDPPDTGQGTLGDKMRKGSRYLYMETLQAPRVAEMIDGFKPGENLRHVKRLLREETEAQWDTRNRIDAAVSEMLDLGIQTLTPEQEIRIMINIRNQENATEATLTLMERYGFEEVPELTADEQKIVNIIKKHVDQDADKIAALYEETNNEPFVRLPGRILPLKYEGENYLSAQEAIRHDRHRTTQTEQGFTIARKRGVKRMPRVDVLGIFEQAINEQQWYLHMQPVLDDIAKLVKTRDYVEKAGAMAANWWVDHLDIVARRGWSATAHHSPFASLLRHARGNITTAILGYRLSSIIMQPFAIFDGMAYAQSRWGASAALRVAKEFTNAWINPRQASRYIETSPKLQLRFGGEVAIQETLARIGKNKGVKARFIKSGLALLQKADIRTAAGVQQGLHKVLDGQGVANAQQEAEFLMELVSSSAEVTFRPHLLARGEGARTWFTFQTFFLNRWGLIAHDMIAKGLIRGDWRQKYAAMVGLAVMVAGQLAEDEAREFLYELINRRELPERPALERAFYSIPSNIPFFGNFFEAYTGRPGSDIPLVKIIGDLFKVEKVISGDTPEAKTKGVLKALESLVTLTAGTPGTSQFFDLIEGTFLVEDKRREPKTKVAQR